MVDFALGVDPRIARIKEEEKAARLQKKAAKGGPGTPASKKAQEEEARKKAEADAIIKEEEDKVTVHALTLNVRYTDQPTAQKLREQSKKDKTAAANAAKKARRLARQAEEEGI